MLCSVQIRKEKPSVIITLTVLFFLVGGCSVQRPPARPTAESVGARTELLGCFKQEATSDARDYIWSRSIRIDESIEKDPIPEVFSMAAQRCTRERTNGVHLAFEGDANPGAVKRSAAIIMQRWRRTGAFTSISRFQTEGFKVATLKACMRSDVKDDHLWNLVDRLAPNALGDFGRSRADGSWIVVPEQCGDAGMPGIMIAFHPYASAGQTTRLRTMIERAPETISVDSGTIIVYAQASELLE